ncbi:PilN domain-containing protein [Patescibacteria group bacterium]|nr:PilN domain-containing protein [Patescibacteria group bacterium]
MKKATQIEINLVPKDPFFSTVIGKILRWSLSAGRYIVIFTELVVIMSFITRFSLDRKVTDLNSSINQKKQIVLSYGDTEENFRTIQEKILQYKQTEQETNIVDTFASMSNIMPEGIVLEELAIRPTSVIISGKTLSQNSFNLLINNLQISPDFSNINVNEVESSSVEPGLFFNINVDTRPEVKIKQQPTKEETVDLLDRTQGL